MTFRTAIGLTARVIPATLLALPLVLEPAKAGQSQPTAAVVDVDVDVDVDAVASVAHLADQWTSARERMAAAGVTIKLNATSDIAANVSGGLRRGRGASGLIRMGADLDLGRIAGWAGSSLHVGAFLIGGHGLGDALTGALGPMSNIQARPAGRLADAYLQQKLLDGRLVIRVGQFAAEGEFASAETTATFINATFDWPALNAVLLPGGGPAYPVPTAGVHVSYKLADHWTVQAGVFNGNPMGDRDQNTHGLTFPLNTGALIFTEIERRHVFASGLSGVVKLGAWYNSGRFANVRLSAGGVPLALADAAADVRQHRGNYAVYGLVDQTVWRDSDLDRKLSVFARLVVAPVSARSHVDFYADAGLALAGVFPERPNDVAGFGVAYARISQDVRRHDAALAQFGDTPHPAHTSELLVEASYQSQITPLLKLQPFAQLVVRPGGGAVDPARPSRRIRDAVVIGLRGHAEFYGATPSSG